MKSRLMILDLDGTLYDTRKVNCRAYQHALKEHDIELDEEYFIHTCNGQYYKQFLPVIAPRLSDSAMESIHRRKQELYPTYLASASVNGMLVDLITAARPMFHIALVTSASRKNALDILQFFDHTRLFDLILTQEDVTKKKPDPEGFELAMRHFDVRPEMTVVFEDSDSGILAAKAAGASVYRVMDYIG